jgi:hypothetical protein
VITTRSRELGERIPEELADKIKHIDLSAGDALPARAEPGTVYIVTTGVLSHRLFVAMMAYCTDPVLITGDGSLSAAVWLKEFALLQVVHGGYIPATVAARLLASANTDEQRQAIHAAFHGALDWQPDAFNRRPKNDLSHATELGDPRLAAPYTNARADIPILTDRVLHTIAQARQYLVEKTEGQDPVDWLRQVRDPDLRDGMLLDLANNRMPGAIEAFVKRLQEGAAFFLNVWLARNEVAPHVLESDPFQAFLGDMAVQENFVLRQLPKAAERSLARQRK